MEPSNLKNPSKTALVKGFQPLHLSLGCVPYLTTIRKNSDNCGLVDPNLHRNGDAATVPDVIQSIESTGSFPYSDCNLPVEIIITTNSGP